MGMVALSKDIEAAEPASALRRELAEGINAAWQKSRERILKLGRLLVEARQKLPPAEFDAMLESDLDFSKYTARQLIRIATDPRCTCNALPEAARAMDVLLGRLNEAQFESAIAKGDIHPELTVKDAEKVVRDYIRIDAKPHRPLSAAKHDAPSLPRVHEPRSWSEMVALHIGARRAVGRSQGAVDDGTGWPEGMASKYEIPHQDDGRIPEPPRRFEWLQGIQPKHNLGGDYVAVHAPLLRGYVGFAFELEVEVAALRAVVSKGST